MSYNNSFQQHFIKRSLELIQTYQGPYDSTILLNCLLGLVIVPAEACLNNLPLDKIRDPSSKWGISKGAIIDCNPKSYKDIEVNFYCLRHFILDLRNSISHFFFKPNPEDGEVQSFKFWNNHHGFRAEIEIGELRIFVKRLAKQLNSM